MSDTREPFLQPGSLGMFAIKTCIVGAVLSICTVYVAKSIIDSAEESLIRGVGALRSTLQAVGSIDQGRVYKVLGSELERAASPNNDFPPATRQKVVDEIHVVVARWRPFIDAFVDEMQKPAANPPAPAK